MVRLDVRARDGYIELKASGHAGDKTICAAISAILQTAILGLQEIARQYPMEVEITIQDESADVRR